MKLKNNKLEGSHTIKKLFLLNNEEKQKVLMVIDNRIKELEANGDTSKKNFDKKLGYLHGIKELLLED